MRVIIKYILYPIFIIIILLNILLLLKCLYHIIPGFSMFGENKEVNDFFSFWMDIFAVAASTGMIIITAQSIISNSKENNKNRTIQQNLMIFQVENHNLNQFKEAAINLCNSYGYNNIVTICNIFLLENKSPLEQIKMFMNDIANKHKLFLMNFLPKAYGMKELLDEEENVFQYYNTILLDLEVITSYLNFSSDHVATHIVNDEHCSKLLSDIIANNISDLNTINPKRWLNKILNLRLDEINPNYMKHLWIKISDVYLNEKSRIGNYLIENGTEQIK